MRIQTQNSKLFKVLDTEIICFSLLDNVQSVTEKNMHLENSDHKESLKS